MPKELFSLAEKVKALREQLGLTQAEMARRLGLTRSSVNCWEMGLSVPSAGLLIELSKLFHVTTDYLLGVDNGRTIAADNLTEKEIASIVNIIQCLRESKQTPPPTE